MKNYSIEIIYIILSIVFPSIFIGIFFFTYGKNIEKECVVNNVNFLIADTIEPIKSFISDDQKKILLESVNNIKLENMDEQDKKVEDSNNLLLKKSFIILSSVFLGGIVLSYIIYRFFSNKIESFPVIITKNIIILLLGIVLVEFLFGFFIPSQFISANPNLIKKRICENIKKINY